MKRNGLVAFFVLAFVLPWAVWGTTIAEQHGLIGWHVPSSLAFWLGLTIAAYVAAAVSGGAPAVSDLLRRLVRVRVAWFYYAATLLLVPVLAGASVLMVSLFGVTARVGQDVSSAALPGVFALNLWLFLITEETAWRGFALPRLQARMSPLGAALVLGLVWGVWHLPLFLTEGTFQARIPFLGFMLSILATSVIISWLFDHARGSVLLAALLHASADVTIAYSGVMTSGGLLFWLFVVVQCAVAAFLAQQLLARAVPEARWPAGESAAAGLGVASAPAVR